MGSDTVVVQPPLFQAATRFLDADEQVLVEALVTALAIEALHERVLHRLAWPDEAELHVTTVCPRIDRPTEGSRRCCPNDSGFPVSS